MKRLRTLFLLLPLGLVLVAADDPQQGTTFVFERFNGTHSELGGDASEIENGPVTVRPTTKNSHFEIFGNRLELEPAGEGEHDATFWVHFEGAADVEAEILMAGFTAAVLQDEVTVVNQEKTIRSRIKIESREEDYLITIVEPPKEMSIQVRSRLGTQIVSMCESLTRFAFGANCDGLDTALSNPRLPMAEAGEEMELDLGQLTANEKAQLDAYLAATAE